MFLCCHQIIEKSTPVMKSGLESINIKTKWGSLLWTKVKSLQSQSLKIYLNKNLKIQI